MKGITDAKISGEAGVEIEHLEYDSRLVRENSLFFAVTGFKRDGYEFVEDARARGAVAVMGEREAHPGVPVHVQVPDVRAAMADVAAAFYGYPGKNLNICGVTGTNGKTTTCHLIRTILDGDYRKTGIICSAIYDTGAEQFPAERTTPESLDLQRLLYLMIANACTDAVIEVSSHALILKRVEHIDFTVVVYTNLTRDHLDFHESMDDYLRAKALLLDKLSGARVCAVINIDVPEFRPLFGGLTSDTISYSLQDSSADVYCASYKLEPHQTAFDVVTPQGARTVVFGLPGKFNLLNGIAATAGGLAGGVELDAVVHGLEAAQPVPGRFVPISAGQPFALIVDYAHTPDALERLCESARDFCRGRVLLLFGCGGDRDRGKRALMGTAATTHADRAVVTSDNPRSEDPQAIIEEIKPGLSRDNYEIEPDREAAIALILNQAREGDVVLLAGKGAENYQEIKGERHPFDDARVARQVLADLGYKPENTVEEH